ncbi:MAG: Hint domain-containing protein [Candidatus Sungbacteria bacterium]|nr:Hint domain-containing protein [bacterium]MDZ4260103.1 Hint domain-containing protein [Candidatus Sungbacteria bacterium]
MKTNEGFSQIIALVATFGVIAVMGFYQFFIRPVITEVEISPSPTESIYPTPTPTRAPDNTILPAGKSLSPTELKYAVIKRFGNPDFCDPDYYPVARVDEQAVAIERFPELRNNTEEFSAIMKKIGLDMMSESTAFTPFQKLTIYREHKKLNSFVFEKLGANNRYHFEIQVALPINKDKGDGMILISEGTISIIGRIIATERETYRIMCPICLSGATRIDTPQGMIAAKDIRESMDVWTSDEKGNRMLGIVIQTGRMRVPKTHEMIHAVLFDGRELFVSPGHPTADGRLFGNLAVGVLLDGSRIASIDRVPYSQEYTYDLLPSGPTGFYWANGILVGSTLAK